MDKPPDNVDLPGTKVLDDYTVEVKLTEPYVIFPLVFIDNTFNIVPKEEVLAAGDDWGTKVVMGSGPFKLAEWKAGEHIYLERHAG
jgi:ABC-type oligopeptide transport system substrate-binding subunit